MLHLGWLPCTQGLPENHRRPQATAEDHRGDRRRPEEITGKLNIKCDAKFYVKLAVRGKANVGLYSEFDRLVTR